MDALRARRVRGRLVRAIPVVAWAASLSRESFALEPGRADSAPRPELPAEARADEVSFDLRGRTLDLSGNVRIDAPPFHLRAEELTVSRSRYGIQARGRGELAFCPCLGTPIAVQFREATVAPPQDVFMTDATLRVYGVPVAYAPWFWLRGAARPGLLPPDVAYRGRDGLFLGGGVHLPWGKGARATSLDLRSGAYTRGGSAYDVHWHTARSEARVRFDHLEGDGLAVDARGSTADSGPRAAWDLDALRGARGVRMTTSLDEAVRPWDRAVGESSLRLGDWVVATSLRSVARRGGGLGEASAIGPVATLHRASTLGGVVTYQLGADGGALRLDDVGGPPLSMSFVRTEGDVRGSWPLGPALVGASVSGAGQGYEGGERAASSHSLTARASLAAPMGRAFGSPRRRDPLLHVLEPRASVLAVAAGGGRDLGVLAGRGAAGLDGRVAVPTVGIRTALGRWGARDGVDLQADAGLVAVDGAARLASAQRVRVSASLHAAALVVDGVSLREGERTGAVLFARGRLGARDSVHLRLYGAGRSGVDPLAARALTDTLTEAPLGFLRGEGASGGGAVSIPWAAWIATTAGTDVDLTARELLATRAAITLRDRCDCLAVGVHASQRVGRPGTDAWLTVDLVRP